MLGAVKMIARRAYRPAIERCTVVLAGQDSVIEIAAGLAKGDMTHFPASP